MLFTPPVHPSIETFTAKITIKRIISNNFIAYYLYFNFMNTTIASATVLVDYLIKSECFTITYYDMDEAPSTSAYSVWP